MITKKIKNLIQKPNLTGDEVGRLMILDLLATYENITSGKGSHGVLSDSEKIYIVERLVSIDAHVLYDKYKKIHDFFTNVPALLIGYMSGLELQIVSLNRKLFATLEAERENIAVHASGIALKHVPFWKKYMAEELLKTSQESIKKNIESIKKMMKECLARQKSIELIGRLIEVPETSILINSFSTDSIEDLNRIFREIPETIERFSMFDGERPATQLKNELCAILIPIDIDAFKPSPETVETAYKTLDLDTINGRYEAFVSILKK